MKRIKHALLLSVAGAGLLAVSAFAQQPTQPSTPVQPQTQTTQPSPTMTTPPASSSTQMMGQDKQRSPGQSSADHRSAFVDARLASIRAGLRLTPEQERLWPPVETAARDMMREMMEMRDQRRSQASTTDPVERMARMGEAATKRGAAMTRLAEAARPLYAALNDEQKDRLRVLMRGHGQRDRMMARDDGHYRGHHHYYHHHDRMWDRDDRGYRDDDRYERRGWRERGDMGDMRGMRDRDMRDWRDSREGRWDRDWRSEREWRDYDRGDSRWNDWR